MPLCYIVPVVNKQTLFSASIVFNEEIMLGRDWFSNGSPPVKYISLGPASPNKFFISSILYPHLTFAFLSFTDEQ